MVIPQRPPSPDRCAISMRGKDPAVTGARTPKQAVQTLSQEEFRLIRVLPGGPLSIGNPWSWRQNDPEHCGLGGRAGSNVHDET